MSNSRLVLGVGLDHASEVAERRKVLLGEKEREKTQHLWNSGMVSDSTEEATSGEGTNLRDGRSLEILVAKRVGEDRSLRPVNSMAIPALSL